VKQPGSNSAAVANAVKALPPRAGAGAPLQGQVAGDQSAVTEANAHEVWVAILFGGAMAILNHPAVPARPARHLHLLAGAPTSVIGTLFVMYAIGLLPEPAHPPRTLARHGLLIDDAVVVRESITRRLDGASHRPAASRGTRRSRSR